MERRREGRVEHNRKGGRDGIHLSLLSDLCIMTIGGGGWAGLGDNYYL